jgi:hypothetical protein
MRVQAKFPHSLFPQTGQKLGKNGMNVYRAVLITGSPGIEKTNRCVFVREIGGVRPVGDERY